MSILVAPISTPANVMTVVIPTATPTICGSVRRNPKFTPDAVTNANRGPKVEISIATIAFLSHLVNDQLCDGL